MPIPQKYLLPLSFAVCSIVTNPGLAQTAAPAAVSAPAPAPAVASAPAADSSAPATSAPAPRAARPAASGAAPLPLQPWDRPADGPPVFWEDFESGKINPNYWVTRVAGDATITVEQDVVAHGKNALHVHYPKGTRTNSWAFIGLTVQDSLRDHFYGRAYMMIKGIPQTHSVYILSGSVGFPVANFLEIGTDRGTFQPSYQLNATNPHAETTPKQGDYPLDRWFCLEWEFNDQPDRIVLWVDGKLVANQALALRGVSSGLTGGFKEFDLGFRSWVPTAANDIDIYYDDIAIGDKPIGQLTPVPALADAKPAAAADSSTAK
jgi:hypothetical protein